MHQSSKDQWPISPRTLAVGSDADIVITIKVQRIMAAENSCIEWTLAPMSWEQIGRAEKVLLRGEFGC